MRPNNKDAPDRITSSAIRPENISNLVKPVRVGRKSVFQLAAPAFCMYLSGCASFSTPDRLGDNYYAVTYTHSFISEPQAHRTALQYREPDGRWFRGRTVTIWPSVHGISVTNHIAVFTADVARGLPWHGERWPMQERLFALRFPGQPVDITDQLVANCARGSGRDAAHATARTHIVYWEHENQSIVFHFGGIDNWPEAAIPLDWDEVLKTMAEVRDEGVTRKDAIWGTTYTAKANVGDMPK